MLEGEERLVSDETFEVLRWKRTFDNTPWIVNLIVRSERQHSEGGVSQHSVAGDNGDCDSNVVIQRDHDRVDHERFVAEREGHRRRRLGRDWSFARPNGDVHGATLNSNGRDGTLLHNAGAN